MITAPIHRLSSKKLIFPFLFSLLIMITSAGYTALHAQTAESDIPLWEIKGEGKGKIYIAASLPVFHKDSFAIQEAYNKVLAEASCIGFERNPDSLRAEYQLLFMENGFFETDDHLEDNLSPKTFKKLDKRLTELNKPLGHHARMKPWLLALTLQKLEVQAAGYDEEGMDRYFYDQASKEGKSIFSLNSKKSLQKELAEMPLKKQETYLKRQLKKSVKNVGSYRKIGKAWNDGKLNQTGKYVRQLDRQFSKSAQLETRELKPKIHELLKKEETLLLLLSPAYLSEKNSLLNQLKKDKTLMIRLYSSN